MIWRRSIGSRRAIGARVSAVVVVWPAGVSGSSRRVVVPAGPWRVVAGQVRLLLLGRPIMATPMIARVPVLVGRTGHGSIGRQCVFGAIVFCAAATRWCIEYYTELYGLSHSELSLTWIVFAPIQTIGSRSRAPKSPGLGFDWYFPLTAGRRARPFAYAIMAWPSSPLRLGADSLSCAGRYPFVQQNKYCEPIGRRSTLIESDCAAATTRWNVRALRCSERVRPLARSLAAPMAPLQRRMPLRLRRRRGRRRRR